MDWALRLYSWIIAFGKLFRSPLLLILRLYFGITWFLTGLGKWKNLDSFIQYLDVLHIPYPALNAYLVATVETVGGLFLAIGLLSRLVSIPLAISMIVAYITAHTESVQKLFTDPQLFVSESPFNYLLTALLVLAFGPGIFSIDYWIQKKIEKHRVSN